MKVVEDSSLQYKDHKDFFEEYFKIRSEFVRGLSSLSFSNDKQGFVSLFKSLSNLYDWTNNYIFNEKIPQGLDEIQTKISKFQPNNNILAKNIISDFKFILKLINQDHEKAEILPKKMMFELSEEDKFYKEEEKQPLKYAKKAFTDLILKRF